MTHPARIVAFLSTSALCLGLAGAPEAMAERAWERATATQAQPLPAAAPALPTPPAGNAQGR